MQKDFEFMNLAIKQAHNCISSETAFNVGALLVHNDSVLATGYSRELEGNTHAEQCCFIKLEAAIGATLSARSSTSKDLQEHIASEDVATFHAKLDLVLYTTMEPCAQRLSLNIPCTSRIISFNFTSQKYRIIKVVQGCKEPQRFVGDSKGTAVLRKAGVAVEYLEGLEEEISKLNIHLTA